MVYHTKSETEFFTHERCHIIEIMNTDVVPHLSIAQARVAPGVTTQLHSLKGDEFYYILEGIGRVEIDEDFKKEVKKGDIVHIKAGLSQRITNSGEKDLIFLCMCTPRFKQEDYRTLE